MINLHIPVLPRGKGSIRVSNGNAYKDEKTREYMKLVSKFIEEQYHGPILTRPLKLELTFAFPCEGFNRIKWRGDEYMRHKPDLDNLEKAVCDAASGIIWDDDALIVSKTSEKIWSEVSGTFLICSSVV